MKVVNLFAGHGTWTIPFRARGHQVWATDIVARPGIDLVKDILEIDEEDLDGVLRPDILLASPDCTAFSVASIGTHWTGGKGAYVPRTQKAYNRIELVEKTVQIIGYLQPTYFILENPRGLLRKLHLLDRFERRSVWYCRYGDERAKPTDLWGGFPESLNLRPGCRNGASDHAAAPRGAKTGTQGRKKDARSFIPYELALDVCLAAEKDI